LAWPECHDTTRRDWDFLAGFRITPRALSLIAQVKVAETGQLYLFVMLERLTDFLEKQLDQLLGLALIQA